MKCTIYWTLIYGIILDSEGTDMLNFIIGTAGSGKSHTLQHKLIKESINNPDSRFVLLVPDQYSLEAQKEILDKHPNHGAFNIEVSSFNRLAYEILDEQGFGEAKMMDELTKSILVRRALIDCAKELKVYGGKINMPGFTEKVKSILDEFGQYGIDEQGLKDIISLCDEKSTLKKKLEDVEIIRNAFNKYVDNLNLTSEELLKEFISAIDSSDTIKNTYIYLDGFTGFTPIQENVILKLAEHAKDVTLTATMKVDDVEAIINLAQDKGLRPEDRKIKKEELLPSDNLFYLGKNTVYRLASEAKNLSEPELLNKDNRRLENNEVLSLVSKNIFGEGTDTYDKPQDSLELHEAASLEEEVLSVVKTISSKVRTKEYKYSDFAVLTGDMENYYKYIAKLFKKYEIPVFIDYKRSTAVNMFADFIIALVRLVEYNFSYTSLFHVLRSDICDINQDDIDYIENYTLTFRRTSFKSFSQEWKRKMNGIDLNRINVIRAQIYDYFKDFMSAMTKKDVTVSDYCKAIYAFLEKINVSEKVDSYVKKFKEEKEYALEEEYSQIYSEMIRLLEGLENTLSDEKIKLDDFEALTISAIEELKIGIIPPGIDDVMVGDIERTRLKDVKKVIFLIGANDGIIPKVSAPATIINDVDRETLKKSGVELAPTTKDNVFKQMFYLYTIINKPTEKLVVSYSTQDKDSNPIKKSYFVDNLETILENTPVKRDLVKDYDAESIINKNVALDYMAENGLKRRNTEQTDDEIKIYNAIQDILKKDENTKDAVSLIRKGTFFEYKDATLSKDTAKDLYKENAKVTRIQTFVGCPYRQFLTYGLRLYDREVYEFDNLEKGTIEHAILENFFKKAKDQRIDLTRDNKESIDSVLDKSIDEELNSERLSEYFRVDPASEFTKHQLGKMAKESVGALVEHLDRGQFEIAGIEDMGSGGKVDRVDKFVDGKDVYLKVIDYKTGSTSFKYNELMTGRNIQVFVYLKDAIDSAKREHPDKNIIPAGAFYFHVTNPYVDKVVKAGETKDENASQDKRRSSYIMEGLVNEECVEAFDTENNVTEIIKKDSNSENEYAFNSEQYEDLLGYVGEKIETVREEIQSGEISVDPYKSACEYCSFKGICRQDLQFKDPKEMDSMKKSEALEMIYGEEE